MKKLFLLFSILTIILLSCSKKEKVPEGVYSKQLMAEVMMDVYLLEAKVRDLNTKQDSTRVIYDYYEKKIFSEHGVDDSIYQFSFEYYVNRPIEMSEIYTIMVDSLSLKERLESKPLAE